MKKCPFCAEEIQDAAIVCRFCGRDLGPPAILAPPSPVARRVPGAPPFKPHRSNLRVTAIVFGTAIALTIGTAAAIFIAALISDRTSTETGSPSSQLTAGRMAIPKWGDEPSSLVAAYGTPDVDDSTAYDTPRPPIPTRILTYRKADVKALYRADAPLGAPPPYVWKLIGFTDASSARALTMASAAQRLSGR